MTYIFPHPEKEPWIYKASRLILKNEPRNGAMVYGDTIYTDSELAPDVLEHEMFHVHQQEGKSKVLWALRYLLSKRFRLQVEVEAYRHQYEFICYIENDRNLRSRALHSMAKDLSSPLYGSIVSYDEAHLLISRGPHTYAKGIISGIDRW